MSDTTPKTDARTDATATDAHAATEPVGDLRSEPHRWLLVGHRYIEAAADEPSSENVDVFCSSAADLPAFVARFWVRNENDALLPYLWLAPHLRDRWVELVAPRMGWADRIRGPAADAVITTDAHGRLDRVNGERDNASQRLAALCGFTGGAFGNLFVENLREYGLPAEGRVGELHRQLQRSEAGRLLYEPEARAGGYVYVVTAHDRDARERGGEPYLQTLDGDALLPAQNRGVLPGPAAEVWAFFRQWHRNHAPDCTAWPTQAEFAAYIKQRRLSEPPPAAPPPDAKLAEKIANYVQDQYDEKGVGPNKGQVTRRMRRRPETVAAVLDWLIRQGRVKLGPRGARGEHEYLPG